MISNPSIFKDDNLLFDFIARNADEDVNALLLHPDKTLGEEKLKLAARQIALRKKFNHKFPKLLSNPRVLLPDRSVVEQASSEATASYLASIIPRQGKVVDLTAGLGINTLAFAEVSESVIGIELDRERAEFLKYNVEIQDIENVKIVCADCTDWIENNHSKYDVMYIDPARRDNVGIRTFDITQYSPDVISMLPVLKRLCNRLLIKVSPFFDIQKAIQFFPEIQTVHIIDYKNECKELILDLNFSEVERFPIIFKCVELTPGEEPEINEYVREVNAADKGPVPFASLDNLVNGMYLYRPYPSIRKSGLVRQLCSSFPDFQILSPNTMLFVSSELNSSFSGKVFLIKKRVAKKDLKILSGSPCNVLSRNYPLSSEELSRRYKFSPSGNTYLIATVLSDGSKVMLLCELI